MRKRHDGGITRGTRVGLYAGACLVALAGQATLFGGASLVGVAKEWTQLANNAELVFIATQEVRQLDAQIRQYQWMVEQGHPLAAWQVRDAIGDLRRLSEIVALGSETAEQGAAVDELLRAAYPGYEHYAGTGTYAADYRRWNDRRMDAIRGAYYAADLHAVQFRDEAAAAREIERQMQTARGQMQVLQASGRLASLEVEQLQKLRQLVTVQIKMQGEILAVETDRAAAEDAGLEKDRAAARAAADALEARRGESYGVWGDQPIGGER